MMSYFLYYDKQFTFISKILLLIIILLVVHQTSSENVTIPNLGTFIGSTTKTARTQTLIYQFLGVRYAESPSGSNRFKPPITPEKLPIEQNVTVAGRPCPVLKYIQNMTNNEELNGDLEDCLHLSIYSRNLSDSNIVMVYVHGGALEEGAAYQHPPNYLLEENIVLVVPQYRLGPLGFLSTNTSDISGNFGLLDILFALHWIKSNIIYFGGNPSKITIFGQSAGAAIISALMLSPLVPADLFQNAILQSGAIGADWAVGTKHLQNSKEIAKLIGCKTNEFETSILDLNKCLMDSDVVTLLKAYEQQNGGSKFTFGGVSNDILPQNIYELMTNYNRTRKNISLMAGVTKNDGSFVLAGIYDQLKARYNVNANAEFNRNTLFNLLSERLGIRDYTGTFSGYAISQLFTQDQLNSGNFTQLAPGLIDLCGTAVLKAPLLTIVQLHSRYYPNQTYLYSFDYSGEFTRFGYGEDTSHYPFDGGVHHSNDNIYLFPWPEFASHLNKDDTRMSQTMVNIWTSFARNGIPKSDDVLNWPSVTRVTGPFMHINQKCYVDSNFLNEYSVAAKEARSNANSIFPGHYLSYVAFIAFIVTLSSKKYV